MKKVVIVFLILSNLSTFSQIYESWSDNFNDADFIENPTWSGSDSVFNASTNVLKLNVNNNGTYCLATTSRASVDATWEFKINFSHIPNNTNYISVYLMSDASNFANATKGYYLRFGHSSTSGTNEIKLHKVGQELNTPLIISDTVLTSLPFSIAVKVTRDINCLWTLYLDMTGGTNYVQEGTPIVDSSFLLSSYFGVLCKPNSAPARTGISFDNFNVQGYYYPDVTKPRINTINAYSDGTNIVGVTLSFSECVSCIAETNIDLQGIGNADAFILRENCNEITYVWAVGGGLPNNPIFNVFGICDEYSNIISDTTINFYSENKYSIVITEIMAKPSDANGLTAGIPDFEYIEIYNRSQNSIDLKDWYLHIISGQNTDKAISTSSLILNPNSYMVLYKEVVLSSTNEEEYNKYVAFVNYLNAKAVNHKAIPSLQALSNTRGILMIKDNNANIVSVVEYTDTWYNSANKKSGGWSLEMIDPISNPCGLYGNWSECINSPSPGGTPGNPNSVSASNPDLITPEMLTADFISINSIDIYFSEQMQKSNIENINNYSILDNELTISSIIANDLLNKVTINFSTDMERGKLYYLRVINSFLTDCVGNSIPLYSEIRFAYADSIVANDVLISEILIEPKTDGKRFIELYNNSDKIIDIKELEFAKDGSSEIANETTVTYEEEQTEDTIIITTPAGTRITTTSRLLLPQEFCAISDNISDIKSRYIINCEECLFQGSIVTLNTSSAGGDLYLRSIDNVSPRRIIDKMHYTYKMHNALLTGELRKGVSLERICLSRPSNDATNWTSASQSALYATPGYANSQNNCDLLIDSEIKVSPETFSPDNDGYQDILNISYKLEKPNYTAMLTIYNSNGHYIKSIANNVSLGMEGNLTWNGYDENNHLCPIGIYILYAEMFNIDGDKIMKKLPFVLSKKAK